MVAAVAAGVVHSVAIFQVLPAAVDVGTDMRPSFVE